MEQCKHGSFTAAPIVHIVRFVIPPTVIDIVCLVI
jgi:hypothetical protein